MTGWMGHGQVVGWMGGGWVVGGRVVDEFWSGWVVQWTGGGVDEW